ncbi:MAG: hypothetical protein IKS41_02295 [Alphaproteobacteria bacterium]|nr:hypothetical protein [Alphaproteobacteria bacterium]
MVFSQDLITPAKEDICQVKQTPFDGGQNIAIYSYTPDKKANYLSHVYHLDKHQNGKEFIYGPKGEFIAEFPLSAGKANGKGKVCYQPGVPEDQYFYYGEVFSAFCNSHIVETDGDATVIELSANLSLFDKAKLTQTKLPDYILNSQEDQMKYQFIFSPVAQNTIVRPLAQAVCMARGGEPVEYVDTADHKTKTVTSNDISYLTLQVPRKSGNVNVDGTLVAFRAMHENVTIRADINDVSVFISRNTTVDGAMGEFQRKIAAYNRKMMRSAGGRQHE